MIANSPATINPQEPAIPLLEAKLHVPPVRSDRVLRPHLVQRLNEGLQGKLVLVSAPAGFGKTTLLSSWAGQSALPVAWVSLDAGDNDPTRFLAYVLAALQTVHSNLGGSLSALQSPRPVLTEAWLTDLINELAGLPAPIVLVLDDFHVITDQWISDWVAALLANAPPRFHVIVSGRADPRWPLARLRARREMTELRARDLRFTYDEAVSYLNGAMRLDLSPEDVAALGERTEGWIVGLQMAALVMRGRLDTYAHSQTLGFTEAFSGNHRFVLDYLVEEVLAGLPMISRSFYFRPRSLSV